MNTTFLPRIHRLSNTRAQTMLRRRSPTSRPKRFILSNRPHRDPIRILRISCIPRVSNRSIQSIDIAPPIEIDATIG